jgi:hypothetical protein
MYLYSTTEHIDLSTRSCVLSLILREDPRLRLFENRVLRRKFGAKRDEVSGNGKKTT